MIEFVIMFMGLIAGVVLGLIAPEELAPGRKYLLWFRNMLFMAILSLFLVSQFSDVILILILLGSVSALLVYDYDPVSMLLYWMLPVFMIVLPLAYVTLMSSLIFPYVSIPRPHRGSRKMLMFGDQKVRPS